MLGLACFGVMGLDNRCCVAAVLSGMLGGVRVGGGGCGRIGFCGGCWVVGDTLTDLIDFRCIYCHSFEFCMLWDFKIK